ncbi:hypothetical protein, partial [Bacillus velezensis]|uniref:hypothetical protein n=1 Tax=Bacillus velezensis TaxID=492670 RepID=UPI003CF12B93
DTAAHGPQRTRNSRYIAMAEEGADEVMALIHQGIADNQLSLADLFDTDYRAIEGSNPTQYQTRFTAFADALLRPTLDRRTSEDSAIVGCCLIDMNG